MTAAPRNERPPSGIRTARTDVDLVLPPEVIAAGGFPRGHPEGFREVFANIYGEFDSEPTARDLGETPAAFP